MIYILYIYTKYISKNCYTVGVLRFTFFLDISFCHDGFFKVNPLSLTLFANFEFWFRFCQHSYTQEKTGAWEEWPESNDPTSAWILGFDCNLKRLTSHHVRPWGTFGDALNPWAMSNFQTIPNSFFLEHVVSQQIQIKTACSKICFPTVGWRDQPARKNLWVGAQESWWWPTRAAENGCFLASV
jgi:hypothetical protein